MPGSATNEECTRIALFTQVMQEFAIVTTSALFSLRVFAIYAQNVMILFISGIFIVSRLGLDIWATVVEPGESTVGSQFQSLSRCGLTLVGNSDVFSKVQISVPFLALGFDIFIVILTFNKTYRHATEMARLGESSIANLLLRDGSLYFLLMLLVGGTTAGLDVTPLATSNPSQ